MAAKIDEFYREARKVLDDGYFKGSNYIVQKGNWHVMKSLKERINQSS